MTISWLKLVACAFFGGRVSFRPELERMEVRMLRAEVFDESRDAQLQFYREREDDDAIRQLHIIIGNWHDVRIWDGRVQRVEDGDTLVIKPEIEGGQPRAVELVFVECPGLEQPLGVQAKDFMETTYGNRSVMVVENPGSNAGAFVFLSPFDGTMIALNRAVLSEGLAKCDYASRGLGFYAIDSALKLREAEEKAKSKRLGIWAN
jgi:endonuclease YncB( thermonuclease family)